MGNTLDHRMITVLNNIFSGNDKPFYCTFKVRREEVLIVFDNKNKVTGLWKKSMSSQSPAR